MPDKITWAAKKFDQALKQMKAEDPCMVKNKSQGEHHIVWYGITEQPGFFEDFEVIEGHCAKCGKRFLAQFKFEQIRKIKSLLS